MCGGKLTREESTKSRGEKEIFFKEKLQGHKTIGGAISSLKRKRIGINPSRKVNSDMEKGRSFLVLILGSPEALLEGRKRRNETLSRLAKGGGISPSFKASHPLERFGGAKNLKILRSREKKEED